MQMYLPIFQVEYSSHCCDEYIYCGFPSVSFWLDSRGWHSTYTVLYFRPLLYIQHVFMTTRAYYYVEKGMNYVLVPTKVLRGC